jgi:hypothetical protein
MSTLREAAQQALRVACMCTPEQQIAKEALRAALAQPEQAEPVAWMRNDGLTAMPADEKTAWAETDLYHLFSNYTIPLYTTPPRREWRSLSEEDFDRICDNHATLQGAARAIEAALKEKNHG